MMYYRLRILLIPLLLAVHLTACNVIAADNGQFIIAIVGDQNDRITLTAMEGTAIFDIYSPSGIGQAAIRRMAGDAPGRVLLRFHLAGLEELRFTYDTTVITVSVPSTGDPVIRQQVTLAAGENQEIAADSPYWMETRMVVERSPAATAVSPRSGTIDVALPSHFLRTQQPFFMIDWVDFYR